ncbi:MAG TPA: sensor histidine kinase [Chryseolinea sp.]
MRKLQLILFACLVSGPGWSQMSSKKDSLLEQLGFAKEDSTKVLLLLRIGRHYERDNLPEAGKYYQQAGELSKRINYVNGIFKYYARYTDILNRRGQFDSALVVNLESVSLGREMHDSAHLAAALVNTGMSYRQLEEFESAIKYIEEGKGLFTRLGNTTYNGQIDDLLQNLATVMRQYRKGVTYGRKAIRALKQSGDSASLSNAYNNIGLNYINLRLYDSAKYYLKRAAAIAQTTGDAVIQTTNNINLGYIFLLQEDFASMKPYVEKALELSQKNGMPEYEGIALYGLGEYYLSIKEYPTSKKYTAAALTLANQYHFREQKLKLFRLLSNLAFAMQDARSGIHYAHQNELLADSILNESIIKNTIGIEKKFETEKKETQIRLQQTQLRQKDALNYLFAGGAVASLIISALIYRNYKNRQKLQQVRIDELEKEKQLTTAEAMLKGEEQERTRLAKDLHDGLGGMLSGIKYTLNRVKGNLVMTSENAQSFERSMDMLDSSIQEMRRVAHNMMPEILINYGLDAALKEFCDEIDRSGVVHLNYQSVGMGDATIGQTTAVTIYRIVQELVTNALKHAHAQNVLVQLHQTAQEKLLAVTVEDDGIGFNTDMLNQASGMGWRNIQNRVEFLQGKFDIQSSPGKGISVMIEINIS